MKLQHLRSHRIPSPRGGLFFVHFHPSAPGYSKPDVTGKVSVHKNRSVITSRRRERDIPDWKFRPALAASIALVAAGLVVFVLV